MKPGHSLLSVDLIKALASQLIIWHHLAAYSPMSDLLHPHVGSVVDWLYQDARLAVQAFLVVGGFLSARSLTPAPGRLADVFSSGDVVRLVGARYFRLARPYLIALVAAIACAGVARALTVTPETPAAPTLRQLLAHLFLLQDIVKADALSAGVWYVAIDFQLYALLALLLYGARRLARRTGMDLGGLVAILCLVLSAASLFWVNRQPGFDMWAPYFFGSYSLGVFAQWAAQSPRKQGWLAVIILLTLVALVLEWRSRIAVAGGIAVLLATGVDAWLRLKGQAARLLVELGRISYPVFLVHYPVSLLVGAIVLKLWPTSVPVNIAALGAAWLLSLASGALLHYWVERRPVGRSSPVPQYTSVAHA